MKVTGEETDKFQGPWVFRKVLDFCNSSMEVLYVLCLQSTDANLLAIIFHSISGRCCCTAYFLKESGSGYGLLFEPSLAQFLIFYSHPRQYMVVQ